MARVLLISNLPPQLIASEKVEASHYRAWQFLHGMLADGHSVHLCACLATTEERAASAGNTTDSMFGLAGLDHIAIGAPGWVQRVQRIHDAVRPDCVVAVGYEPSLGATKLRTGRPVWMDIYGDQITIQQAYCRRMQSDQGLPTTIGFIAEILRSGDIFSVCGQPQKHMTVGELAMCGRLNHRTFEYDFVRVIPPGSPPRSSLQDTEGSRQTVRAQLGLRPSDCAVLWCGGYNTWTDVDTLFTGLDAAMDVEPALHYVSVGASTYQAHANAYERFAGRVAASRHAARYHLLGWKPWGAVPAYYRGCEIGLNIDALHYETLYGTRTRLVEMIAGGLPVVTTAGTELSALLGQLGAALTFTAGADRELSRALLRLATDPALRREMTAAASRAAECELGFDSTTEPLRAWLRAPSPAPDANAGHARGRRIALHHRLRARGRLAVWQLAARQRHIRRAT